MKSCNDCVHHRVCQRHNKMADQVASRTYPMTTDLIVFCALNKEDVLDMIHRPRGNYMHEIAEAELAFNCPDYVVDAKKEIQRPRW